MRANALIDRTSHLCKYTSFHFRCQSDTGILPTAVVSIHFLKCAKLLTFSFQRKKSLFPFLRYKLRLLTDMLVSSVTAQTILVQSPLTLYFPL